MDERLDIRVREIAGLLLGIWLGMSPIIPDAIGLRNLSLELALFARRRQVDLRARRRQRHRMLDVLASSGSGGLTSGMRTSHWHISDSPSGAA